jgi:branched-chain amino acid aminotransferase
MTILFNGKKMPSNHPCILHKDRGFTLGAGLFETILIKRGVAPAIEYHWRRLEISAPLLNIALPFSKDAFTKMLYDLVQENNLQEKTAAARVTITQGDSVRGILPVGSISPNMVMAVFEYTQVLQAEFSALIVKTRKNEHSLTAGIKSISYLDNILAKTEAVSQGYQEAILLNTASKVADGAVANIFMVKNDKIYTPPISDGALPGVMRAIVLQELKAEFPCIEKSLSAEELLQADEVFLTNALMGVQPISQINTTKYPVFSKSLAIFEALRIKNYI